MTTESHGNWRQNLLTNIQRDGLASLVVFLVALPLCMAISIASGVPVTAGIITGIVGGVVVGLLGGCPLQVSGPAAGLTVVVAELVARKDVGVENLGVIVLLAGTFQAVAGLLRMGQWFRAVAPAVIHGMLAGIGVVLLTGQLHVMVDEQPRKTTLQNIQSVPEILYKGALPSRDHSHDNAARIGILTLTVLVLWRRLAPQRLKLVPAPLVAILAAMAAAAWFQAPIRFVEMPNDLLGSLRLPSLDKLSGAFEAPLLTAACIVALIASAETLLCAAAVDRMHTGPRTRYDKELFAQGVGNMICGALSALPMTGVIVRSSANVDAGAKTRLSAILHGIWLLGVVTLAPFTLKWVPTSALAAVLVYTGYKLISPRHVKELAHYGRGEVAIYFATLATIVASDLLKGVLVGVALSIAKLVYRFSHLKVRTVEERGKTTVYLSGAATFLRLPSLAASLESVPSDTELHIHIEELTYIDHACFDLLMSWQKSHESAGGRLVLDWESLTARFLPTSRRRLTHGTTPKAGSKIVALRQPIGEQATTRAH